MPRWDILSSAAVCAVVVIGVLLRRRPKVHIPLMLLAFAGDLALVLVLTVQRNAVGQAVSGSVPALRYFHIAMATISLGLYVAMLVTGTRLYRTGAGRTLHRRLAMTFGTTRGLVLITSFPLAA